MVVTAWPCSESRLPQESASVPMYGVPLSHESIVWA